LFFLPNRDAQPEIKALTTAFYDIVEPFGDAVNGACKIKNLRIIVYKLKAETLNCDILGKQNSVDVVVKVKILVYGCDCGFEV
jgi:hypothetical protein